MASSAKRKTTMAKLNRERALLEKRAEKKARKHARKLAAAQGEPVADSHDVEDVAPPPDDLPS